MDCGGSQGRQIRVQLPSCQQLQWLHQRKEDSVSFLEVEKATLTYIQNQALKSEDGDQEQENNGDLTFSCESKEPGKLNGTNFLNDSVLQDLNGKDYSSYLQKHDKRLNNKSQHYRNSLSCNSAEGGQSHPQEMNQTIVYNNSSGQNQLLYDSAGLKSKNNQDIHSQRSQKKGKTFMSAGIMNNRIKLFGRLRNKLVSFFKKYTTSGMTYGLTGMNNIILRKMISDKSDGNLSTKNYSQLNGSENQQLNILSNRNSHRYRQGQQWVSCVKDKIMNIGLLNPQDIWMIILQLACILVNGLFFFMLSLRLLFNQASILSPTMLSIVSWVWIFEIFLKLNTSHFTQTTYINSRKKILLLYFSTRSIYDLIPLVLINYPISESSSSFEMTDFFLKLLLFLKIVNTTKDADEIQKQLLVMIRQYYLIQLFNLVFRLFVVGHFIACLWYLIARIENTPNNWINNISSTNSADSSSGSSENNQETLLPWNQLYILAFYWSFTLMATGSNTATTIVEIYFTSIIMLFTTIIFGYMLNTIGLILADMNKTEENKRKDINLINTYMQKKDIPRILQRKVNIDLENYYLKNLIKKTDEENEVLSKISPELNEALKLEYNKNILQNIKLLIDNFSSETLKQLCLEVEEIYYSPNQNIFKEDDAFESSLMYIVSGTDWDKQLESERYSKILGRLKAGMTFGELNFFTGMARKASAKSKDFTTILKIDREQFLEILRKNDKDFQVFCEIKDKIMMYSDLSGIKVQCGLCKSSFHMSSMCETSHFNRDNPYIIYRLNSSKPQERKKIQRKSLFKKISTRKIAQEVCQKAQLYQENQEYQIQAKENQKEEDQEYEYEDEEEEEKEIHDNSQLHNNTDEKRVILAETQFSTHEKLPRSTSHRLEQVTKKFQPSEPDAIPQSGQDQQPSSKRSKDMPIIMQILRNRQSDSNNQLTHLQNHPTLLQSLGVQYLMQYSNSEWAMEQQRDYSHYFQQGNHKHVINRFNLLRKIYNKKKITKSLKVSKDHNINNSNNNNNNHTSLLNGLKKSTSTKYA